MIDTLEQIMKTVVEDSDIIIVDPVVLQEMEKIGIPLKVIPAPTIEQLFDMRKINACSIINNFPIPPNNLNPALHSLYKEIRECILFGLNGAAITMSAIMLEYIIKHTTYVKESGGYQKIDPNKWNEFEEMELSPAIDRAKKAGLIDNKMAKRLHSFRMTIRNPYTHFNIKKITQDYVAQKVKMVNTETGEIEERDMPAKEYPIIQEQVKPIRDASLVFNVFYFVDEIIKHFNTMIQDEI